jgi:hypothetical protein
MLLDLLDHLQAGGMPMWLHIWVPGEIMCASQPVKLSAQHFPLAAVQEDMRNAVKGATNQVPKG